MDVLELKLQASQLLVRGKLVQAEALIREAIRSAPGDAQLHIRLAETLRRLRRDQAAVEVYRNASKLLADEGHTVRAIAALKLALEVEPENLDVVSELIALEVKRSQSSTQYGWERFAPTPLEAAIDYELQIREEAAQASASATPATGESASATGVETPTEPEAPAEVASLDTVPAVEKPVPAEAMAEQRVRYPVIRRLSDREFAIKSNAQGRWLVVSSETPLTARFVEDVEQVLVKWEG